VLTSHNAHALTVKRALTVVDITRAVKLRAIVGFYPCTYSHGHSLNRYEIKRFSTREKNLLIATIFNHVGRKVLSSFMSGEQLMYLTRFYKLALTCCAPFHTDTEPMQLARLCISLSSLRRTSTITGGTGSSEKATDSSLGEQYGSTTTIGCLLLFIICP
jgi:hypothetical protein